MYTLDNVKQLGLIDKHGYATRNVTLGDLDKNIYGRGIEVWRSYNRKTGKTCGCQVVMQTTSGNDKNIFTGRIKPVKLTIRRGVFADLQLNVDKQKDADFVAWAKAEFGNFDDNSAGWLIIADEDCSGSGIEQTAIFILDCWSEGLTAQDCKKPVHYTSRIIAD